jgi:hypothetical protein
MATTTTEAPLHIDASAPHPGRNEYLRAGLVALAEYLTDLDEYPDPWDLFASFVPWQQNRKAIEDWASELLRLVVVRAATPARFNPFDVEVALDYLTGAG